MTSQRLTPLDFLRATLEWNDRTRHGATLSGRVQAVVREHLYPRTSARLSAPAGALSLAELCDLVARDRADEAHLQAVADPGFFYPDERSVEPAALRLTSTFTGESLRVPLGHRNLVEIGAALRDPTLERPFVLDRLLDDTALRVRERGFARACGDASDRRPLFVGHACVTWTDGDLRLWCDPFLPGKSPRYPRRYQPLGPLDFPEREHAVLLTHSHPDHFDPASLLLFPASTRFIVPVTPRESLLSVNLRLRLHQLGFTDVTEVPWWSALRIGGFELTVLPFYGEQPLGWGAEPLDEYNRGNTYAVRGGDDRLALVLADSGSDPRSSLLRHARHLRRELGAVDTLFANHRRWRLHPPQYLLTSVPHYLCYVPDAEIGVRQQLMLEPEELAHFAEVLEARHVVPYAMGGARWHEEIGLGYDHLARRRSTEFDADVHELRAEIEGQPGMSLRRAFTPVVLAAGQTLAADGSAAFVPGLRAPRPAEFRPARPAPPRAYMSVLGNAVTPTILGHLASLTTLDPAAFLLAAPKFCEIYTSPGRDGDLLRTMLARYLRSVRAVVSERASPLTADPFVATARRFERFRAAHATAFRGLRDGAGLLASLRRAVAAVGSTPPELLTAMRHELLVHGRPRRDSDRRRRAAPLVARFGARAVDRALLTAKLVHNMHLTTCSWGHPEAYADEDALFAAALADGADAAS